MQLAFIGLGIIGILLLVFSIQILIKSGKNKQISEFTLDNETKVIEFNSIGLYSICFLGAGFIENPGKFCGELKSESGNLIQLHQTFPHYRFRKNGKLGLEYWTFEINEKGKYTLTFKYLNELIAKKSMLSSKRIFQKNIQADSLKVILKETIPIKSRIFSIIGLVIGINALIWGIVIGFTEIFI